MTKTEEKKPQSLPGPSLEERDLDAPFLHEITPLRHVLLVVFTLLFTILLVGFALFLA